MKRLIPTFIYLLVLAITPFSTHAEALLKDTFGHNIPFHRLKENGFLSTIGQAGVKPVSMKSLSLTAFTKTIKMRQ